MIHALMLLAASAWPANIDAVTAQKLIESGRKGGRVIALDVRTPRELAEGRIPDALHLDFYAPDFNEKLAALDREKTYVVYCAVGGRSAEAQSRMRELGFKSAYNMKGGIRAWTRKRLPLAAGSAKDLDRTQ